MAAQNGLPWWGVILAHAGCGVLFRHGQRFVLEDYKWTNTWKGKVTTKRRPSLLIALGILLRLCSKGHEPFPWAPINVKNAAPTSVGVLSDKKPYSDTSTGSSYYGKNAFPITVTVAALVEFLIEHAKKYPNAPEAVRMAREAFMKEFSGWQWREPFGPVGGSMLEAAYGVFIRKMYDTEDTSEGRKMWAQMLLEFLVRLVIDWVIPAALARFFPGLTLFSPYFTTAAQTALTFTWPRLRRLAISGWGRVKSWF